LLEWNKDDIGLFEENKIKPSSLKSPSTQEYEKRASKRQARKTPKSIKQHITQTGGDTQETLFKPNMNVNPLLEDGSKADVEAKVDVDALYAKPDPEVVKTKTMQRMEAKTEDVTAVVNEFFDEEEPEGDDKLPNPPPMELMTADETKENIDETKENIDETKENIDESDKPNDNVPDDINTTDLEPLIKIDDKIVPTQREIDPIDEDKAADVEPSANNENALVSEITVKKDITTEINTTLVNEEQTLVIEQEIVTIETNEKETEGETEGVKEDADNIPLIDIKKSATKTPSSPGKFGLRVSFYKINTGN